MKTDYPDLRNITQFSSVSPAGNETIWVVTSQGDLVRVSKQGEQRKTNIKADQIALVSFIDSMHGWLADRQSRVWNTSDGGNSWQLVSTPPNDSARFYLPKQLLFDDELHGWIIGIFNVWQTVDGGKNWQERFSVSNASDERVGRLYRAAFVSQESGWVTSSGGVVLRTTDGGKTWTTVAPSPEQTDFHDIAFSDERTGWLIGRPNGGIYLTEDAGKTWIKQLATVDRTLNSIQFLDRNEGWAVGWRATGDKNQDREAIVLHTLDSGRNWSPISITHKERFFDRVLFSDNNHGWLIARDNVYYTDDGGKNWNIVLKLPPIKEMSSGSQ